MITMTIGYPDKPEDEVTYPYCSRKERERIYSRKQAEEGYGDK